MPVTQASAEDDFDKREVLETAGGETILDPDGNLEALLEMSAWDSPENARLEYEMEQEDTSGLPTPEDGDELDFEDPLTSAGADLAEARHEAVGSVFRTLEMSRAARLQGAID